MICAGIRGTGRQRIRTDIKINRFETGYVSTSDACNYAVGVRINRNAEFASQPFELRRLRHLEDTCGER